MSIGLHAPRGADRSLSRPGERTDGPESFSRPPRPWHRVLPPPLTARELAVLDYLPGRLKNQEIAAELYVSVNTLKSHLRNIHRKLDAADRDDAVASVVHHPDPVHPR